MTILDSTYVPPERDPREEGTKHWDTLRQQHMLLIDAHRAQSNELVLKDQRNGDLMKEIDRLTKLREADRNECVSLRTTLQNLASMLITGMRKAEEDRRKASPYAPPETPSEPQGDEVAEGDQANLEELVGRLGKANTGS